MKKLKKYTYTVLLILTCAVASPLIFMKIWETSAEIQKQPHENTVIDLHAADEPEQTTSAPPVTTSVETTTAATTTSAAETTVTTTATPQNYTVSEGDPSYFDDALFIGDSRTVGLRDYGTLRNADYFCSVGLTIFSVNSTTIDGRTLDGVLASRSYGKIYVMLGINEAGSDISRIVSGYSDLVQKLRSAQPDAIICLSANLHVAKSAETEYINNERINGINSGMAGLADEEHVFYINVNPIFDDSSGCLRSELSFDGIHPLAKYYTDWCSWLTMNTICILDFVPEETTDPDPETSEDDPAYYMYRQEIDPQGEPET